MSEQYKKIKDLQKILGSLFKNKKNTIEFDVFEDEDLNKNKYAYIHFKDYEAENFLEAVGCVSSYIKENFSNAIFCQNPEEDGGRKLLVWLPKDSEVKEIRQLEGVYSQKGFKETREPKEKRKKQKVKTEKVKIVKVAKKSVKKMKM